MKPSKSLRSFLLAAGSSLLVVSSASAQTSYTWDITPGTIGAGNGTITGGLGTWNTTNGNWTTDAGANNVAWVNAAGTPKNNAIFSGTAGAVTLGEATSIRNMTFTNTAGTYSVGSQTLNFTSGTIFMSSNGGSTSASVSITSNITGAPTINTTATGNAGRRYDFTVAANGTMALGNFVGFAAGNDQVSTINLGGTSTSTGSLGSSFSTTGTGVGSRLYFNSGNWTLNGNAYSRDQWVNGATVTIATGGQLRCSSREVLLSSGTLHYNNPGAVRHDNTTFDTGRIFRITGGTIDQTSGTAITTSTTNPDMAWHGNFAFSGTNGADSNLFLGTGRISLGATSTTPATRTVTVTNSATTLSVGGVISNSGGTTPTVGTGSLTKAGAGTLELRGANSYTGATTVNAGRLVVGAGSLANTAIAVNNLGSTFAVTGSGTINLGTTGVGTAGATLNLGNSTSFSMINGLIGTVNLRQQDSFATSGLILSGGASLNFEVGSATADTLAVTKAATVSGTNLINVAGVTSMGGGPYNLITALSGLTGTYHFGGSGTPSQTVAVGTNAYLLTLDGTSGTAVTVTVGSPTSITGVTWTGQTNGNGASNSNWNNAISNNWAANTTASAVSNGTAVTFGDTNAANSDAAITNSTVTVAAQGVTPSSTTFNNSAVNYAVSGGSIGGSGALTKSGNGTVTLSNSNTYSGTTTISAGTLSVAVMANGGTASGIGQSSNAAANLIFNGGTLAYTGATQVTNRAFTINADKTATIDVTNGLTLVGHTGTATNGALTKTGAGTLTLTGANTYTGATTVNAGTLVINGNQNAATGTVTVNDGGTLGGSGTLGGGLVVNSGGKHSPGNSPGLQTITGNVTYNTGSIFEWDLNANTAASLDRGTSYDAVNIGGGGTMTVQSGAIFRIILGDDVDLADSFWTTHFITHTWNDIFSGFTSLSGGFSSSNIQVTGQSLNGIGSFTINGASLTYTAVPEPGAALAGLLIAAGLMRRSRRA